MFSNAHDGSGAALREIDPIALGQAGLQALAVAGAAILARYGEASDRSDDLSDGCSDGAGVLERTLPHPHWSILMRAIGAFTDPRVVAAVAGYADDRSVAPIHADALAAMCLRARTALNRDVRRDPRAERRGEGHVEPAT